MGAIVGYAELDALRQSNLLGRLVRERLVDSAGLAMVEPDVDAIAVAVGSMVMAMAGSLWLFGSRNFAAMSNKEFGQVESSLSKSKKIC